MSEVTMIGLDLAKNVFQLHGADASGGRRRNLGRRDDGTQTADVGEGHDGEQDGAHRLGADEEGRSLPGSGRGGIGRPSPARTSEHRRARSGLAQRS